MAKLNLGLRHSEVDTTQREGGGALPDGIYRFEVDEIKVADHYDNRKGYKLDVVLEVIEPEDLKGRKMFLDFGVDDPSKPEFEEWAREGLARLLRAVDFPADEEFDDTDQIIGEKGIARYGLDRKRSDKQNKRYGKVWGYVYPEDADDAELGPAARQEEWFPAKQTPTEDRGRSRDRGSRDEGRSRGSERGSDRGGRDSDRERSRDRDADRGRGRDSERDSRGNEDDDIPFDGGRDDRQEERGEDRPRRGGGSNPWNRERR